MSFQKIIDEIKQNLRKTLSDFSIDIPEFSVGPAKPGFGDVSSNVAFLLSKQLKQSPKDISETISQKYQQFIGPLVSKVEAHPSGNLNFFANWSKLNQIILNESIKDTFGQVNIGNNSTIVVEHTSVNPNKALHIGHVRNVIIGDSISRILRKANYKVNVLNYVDDSGLQVADIIIGFKYLGFSQEPPKGKKFDQYCGDDVYVKTTKKYETDPSLEDIRKKVLKELEEASSETAKIADEITNKVLANQLETCWNLSVSYDCLNYESQIIRSGLWERIFEKLKEMHLIEFEKEGKNAGCWVIRGEGKEEDKVIVRSNGTATYIAKDIPYAAWKLGLIEDPFNYKKYGREQPTKRILWKTTLESSNEPKQNFAGDKVVTIIDSRQARLQKIITQLMSKFKSDPEAYLHLGYESVTLSSDTAQSLGIETKGKQTQMSGRKGLYVNADSVYDLLKNKTKEETKKRNPQMDVKQIDSISHDVGVGTLRYEMIKQDLDKIITFDMVKSLSLEGDTAPYIQYTHARAARILEKAGYSPSFDAAYNLLKDKNEKQLVRLIGLFDSQVRDSAKNLSPKVIARYCHDLAVSFNSFYEHNKVLDIGDKSLENARLCLVFSFKSVITNALSLIGINAPERM